MCKYGYELYGNNIKHEQRAYAQAHGHIGFDKFHVALETVMAACEEVHTNRETIPTEKCA